MGIETLNHAGNTALMIAAAGDRTDALQVLIKAGASVNNQDATGETVLMIAARYRAYRCFTNIN